MSKYPLLAVSVGDRAGGLHTAPPLEELRAAVEDGQILLISDSCSPDRALALRRSLAAWAWSTPPFADGKSACDAVTSFHRYDDDHPRSRLRHRFHQIVLCAGDARASPVWAEARAVLSLLIRLQNELAGTDFTMDDPRLRLKAFNHVRGGGFLQRHVHPRHFLGVVYFLSLSRPGTDYTRGDVIIRAGTPRRDVALGPDFSAGSAVVFRYDLAHEVTPVDPHLAADPRLDSGLWLLAMEPVGAYEVSHPVHGSG